MLRILDDYDWQIAFEVASDLTGEGHIRGALPDQEYDLSPVRAEDVAVLLWHDEGENDGPDWVAAGVTVDNRGFFMSAGCDYTGWDCLGTGGELVICNSMEEMVLFAIDPGTKDRFGIHILGHESNISEDIYDVD